MNDITNLINTMGYPIAVSVCVGYVLYKILSILLERFIQTFDKVTETNEKLVETNHTFMLEFAKIKNDINDVKTDVREIKNIVDRGV